MGSQRYKFMNIKDSDILQLSKDEISLGNMIQSVDNPTSDESITLDSGNTGYSVGIMNFGIKKITSSGGIKLNVNVLDFTSMTIGSTFKFGKYQVESETPWAIEWEIVHQTDEYQIAQTKQIIDLRPFDAKESTNTDSNRKSNGNSNWQYSNIKQFLNSDQATWYSAQHSYDAPPNSSNVWQYSNGTTYNAYDTHKGFLYYFSDEEKSLLKDMTLTLANNTVTDGGGSYTWTGKVWLPTYTQMTGNQNNNISEGTKFDKYSDNNSRIKTIHENCAKYNEYCKINSKTEGTAWQYWMSSAYPSYSCNTRTVSSEGGPEGSSSACFGRYGLAPCICLPRKLGGGVINDTISFYIDDTLYKSPKGYTFSQWVNTSYNYNGWYKNSKKTDRIDNYNTNTYISGITGSTTIEDGKKYTTESFILNFTIDGTSYMAEEDMTWTQWVSSSYNTNGYKISNSKVVDSTGKKYVYNVRPDDVIVNSNTYTLDDILISFSIAGETLDAKIGATWRSWINGTDAGHSTPAAGNWSLLNDKYVVHTGLNAHIDNVTADDKIIENEHYWYSEGSKLSTDFSTLSLGSTFNFGKYQVESETPWAIEWEIVHQTDTYQIAQTKQIIDLRCFDAKESTNTDNTRKDNGNNNWSVSNIKQFLNSDQANWYNAQHSYDAPPNSSNVWQYSNGTTYNAYDTHKGFLYYFSDEEKSLLKDMTFDLANPTVDGGGSYTWTGKVWLPTYTQMGYGLNNNISEGTKFDKYSNNNSRIKTLHENCAKYNEYCKINSYTSGTGYYWMSSVYPTNSNGVRYVYTDGSVYSYIAYYGRYGLAPCICLSKTGELWS